MNVVFCIFVFTLAIVLNQLFYRNAKNTRFLDIPNDRSMHEIPKVRGAGIIFIGISLVSLPSLCYFTSTATQGVLVLSAALILIASISFFDDLYSLSAKLRFLVHCIVGLLIVLFLRPLSLDFIVVHFSNQLYGMVFLFFVTLWAINHFNFMDGLDGFCAIQAIFLLSTYAFFLSHQPAMLYQYFCLILSSSLLAFLAFNFPPAKVFMGDVGSASLGLVTFVIAIIAQKEYQVPIIYWFMLNALFLFDSTLTLLRRIVRGEKWFAPHRKHAYQRLKQMGMNTRTILLGQIIVNSLFMVLILIIGLNKYNLLAAILLQLLILLVIYLFIERRFPMFQMAQV